MDDHMAHRGHGVFDTAHLHAGHLHMLDRHIERFFKSMAAANIPPPLDEATAKSLILRVAAAGRFAGRPAPLLRQRGPRRVRAGPGGVRQIAVLLRRGQETNEYERRDRFE
jgi:4-amino-4-deoxychorismate lyase